MFWLKDNDLQDSVATQQGAMFPLNKCVQTLQQLIPPLSTLSIGKRELSFEISAGVLFAWDKHFFVIDMQQDFFSWEKQRRFKTI